MNIRKYKDIVNQKVSFGLCLFAVSLTFLIAFGLYLRARPILSTVNLKNILLETAWHPSQGQFGLAGFIAGTLWVSAIAFIIAVPLSVLTAVYLSEYSHAKMREFIKPIIDVLAGISPVIYGFWGVMAIVPLVRHYLMPFCTRRFPFFPFASGNYTGFSALSGGIVLAVMIFPIMISIAEEVLRTVPFDMREASLALGATKWQTVKYVVLRKAWPGIVAAIMLGFSRAFGETIAVLMVAGCVLGALPRSIFDPAYPLTALIANTYGEMMSIPLYDSAVLLAALVLLLVAIILNMIGWSVLLHRSE